jgi:DinB superfamily
LPEDADGAGLGSPRGVDESEVEVSRVELLLAQTDEVYDRLRQQLTGLTDDEYFWEPVPGCWTIHRDESGAWVSDYAEPDPDPPPFTTIGWRLAHIADCKVMYHEYAFGARKLTFPDLEAPVTVAAAVARLEEGHQLLREDLAGLTDRALDDPRLTNWGEPWPAWRIFWTMLDHDAHHGAEISCLRDLYRLGRSAPRRS